ncbi:MAG: mechanosensitive ion channel [Deltaproteobacteria bacterium]|nr:mechanosensitive ion channel [Deltaproteobacteria bacterium]
MEKMRFFFADFWQALTLGDDWHRFAAAAVIFLVVLVSGLILHLLLSRSVGSWVKRTETTVDDIILERILKPVIPIFVILGLYMAKNLLFLPPKLNSLADKILMTVLLYLLFSMLIKFFKDLIDYWTQKAVASPKMTPDKADDLVRFAKQVKELVTPILVVIGILTILSNLGFNLQVIWTSLGIGGIAVVVAVKEPLSNFIGRLYIYATGIFDEGHFISFNGWSGTVKKIGYFRTYLELFADMTTISIPNTKFMTGEVQNYYGRRQFIYKWDLDVPYDTEREKVRELVAALKEFLLSRPEVVPTGCWVYLDRLGSYAKVIRVWFKVKLPDWATSLTYGSDILYEIQGIFAAHGVDFAFPTQVVTLNDGRRGKEAGFPAGTQPVASMPTAAGPDPGSRGGESAREPGNGKNGR